MITWMQRHRKYLVVTIWISTIAFIGAGFVGWGQYSYGDKAGAVAKVGDISISAGELQKTYSNLFNQYNQLFQGQFDEKQAQQFGLQRQALRQLVNQALILNLADHYGLQVTDEELLNAIKSQPYFSNKGAFDKEVYAQALKQNHMTIQEYEIQMRKELLIQKTLFLLSPSKHPIEEMALGSALGVADKLSYKMLNPQAVTVDIDEAALKAFWGQHKTEFKNPARYDLKLLKQSPLTTTPDEEAISAYYTAHRDQLKNSEGKVMELAEAKTAIITALNDEATNKEALRLYIRFKKGEVQNGIATETVSMTEATSPFDPEITKEIMTLNEQKSFIKPRKIGNDYVIIKLEKFVPAAVQTYEEAKEAAKLGYLAEAKKSKLQQLANNSYKSFQGNTSDFVTRSESAKLGDLSSTDAAEFLSKLFSSKQKQGFVTLESGNVILYNVLEQKLLHDKTVTEESTVARLKGSLLDEGLIKQLESKYPIEIYVEGM